MRLGVRAAAAAAAAVAAEPQPQVFTHMYTFSEKYRKTEKNWKIMRNTEFIYIETGILKNMRLLQMCEKK